MEHGGTLAHKESTIPCLKFQQVGASHRDPNNQDDYYSYY